MTPSDRAALPAGPPGPGRLPGLRLALFLLPGLLVGPLAAQEPFSIEEVMSAPFPEGLVSSPSSGVVAWVYDDEGVRNVWAMAPGWDGPRQVTSYDQDDGQAISDLVVTPDGRSILYTRGGGPNARGEIPNPRSWVEPAQRALWIIPVQGGEARELGQAGGVTLSPDGSRIAYTGSGGTLWTRELAEGAEPQTRADVRGSPRSLAWSPDGERLAFVSNRGDHAFVGILELDSGSLRYLDPSLNVDQDPAWSPEGDRIAFIRAPYLKGVLPFTPVREALPWSIRVVEPSTGRAWTAWTASEGAGSVFHGVSSPNQLLWGEGDRIVFPWEGTGWLNLYSVPARGGEATPLTPDPSEVQYVSLVPGGHFVLYSGNQDDIDRQHVWRVPVGGGRAEPLTPGTGIEWAPVPVDGEGTVAFMASGATTPARVEFRAGDGTRTRLLPEDAWAEFPSGELVEPQQVLFSAADGTQIHGQLFLPRGYRSDRVYPALLFFHGGSRRQMLLGFHHRGYYHNAYAFNQFLASQGFMVMSVNYRSGIGYGLDFREARNYGADGASEFNDVLGAGLYLRNRYDVNPDRIGLWGGSYGGYLTAMGLARASDLFAAGVDLHGVHDWNVVIKNFVPGYEAEAHPEFAALALASSPMADLDGWRSPVLLIHGDDDRNVPFSESVDLSLELRRRGVEFEELVFPDEVHGFLLHENWLAAYRAAADFFKRKLPGGK